MRFPGSDRDLKVVCNEVLLSRHNNSPSFSSLPSLTHIIPVQARITKPVDIFSLSFSTSVRGTYRHIYYNNQFNRSNNPRGRDFYFCSLPLSSAKLFATLEVLQSLLFLPTHLRKKKRTPPCERLRSESRILDSPFKQQISHSRIRARFRHFSSAFCPTVNDLQRVQTNLRLQQSLKSHESITTLSLQYRQYGRIRACADLRYDLRDHQQVKHLSAMPARRFIPRNSRVIDTSADTPTCSLLAWVLLVLSGELN